MVGYATIIRLRQTPLSSGVRLQMFESLRARWTPKQVLSSLLVLLLVVAFLFFAYGNARSPGQNVPGVVLSSGATSFSGVGRGTREVALVQLSSGRTVSALVISGGPLSRGTRVTLLERSRLWGGQAYEVISAQP